MGCPEGRRIRGRRGLHRIERLREPAAGVVDAVGMLPLELEQLAVLLMQRLAFPVLACRSDGEMIDRPQSLSKLANVAVRPELRNLFREF